MKRLNTNVDSSVLVLVLLFLHRILLFFSLDIMYTYDSYEYIIRNGFDCFCGKVDRYRLPVYPMLIDVFQGIFNKKANIALCVFQLLISLLSIFVFYLIAKKVTNNKIVSMVITCIYSTIESISGWDKTILTESISLSLTVFILYGMISYLLENKVRFAVLTSVLLVVGCFLRAVFVIYAGLFFGALILLFIFSLFDKTEHNRPKKKSLLSIGIASFPVLLVLLYAYSFYLQFGSFTISDSYLGQQLVIVLQTDMYKDSSNKEITRIADDIINSKLSAEACEGDRILDPEIESRIQTILNEKTGLNYDMKIIDNYILAGTYILDTYSRKDVQHFVDSSMKNHRMLNIQRMISKSFETYSAENYQKVAYERNTELLYALLNNTISILIFNVLHSFVVSLVEIITFIYYFRKRKEANWIRLGLGVFILSTVVLSLAGTNSEYARTAITALPFMFIAFAFYLRRAIQHFNLAIK